MRLSITSAALLLLLAAPGALAQTIRVELDGRPLADVDACVLAQKPEERYGLGKTPGDGCSIEELLEMGEGKCVARATTSDAGEVQFNELVPHGWIVMLENRGRRSQAAWRREPGGIRPESHELKPFGIERRGWPGGKVRVKVRRGGKVIRLDVPFVRFPG